MQVRCVWKSGEKEKVMAELSQYLEIAASVAKIVACLMVAWRAAKGEKRARKRP